MNTTNSIEVATSRIWRGLKNILDPELAIDIVELGMVRDVVEVQTGAFQVELCLTSLSCPVWDIFVEQVNVEFDEENFDVRVQFLTRPSWSPDWMSASAREQLVAVGLLPVALHGQQVGDAMSPERDAL